MSGIHPPRVSAEQQRLAKGKISTAWFSVENVQSCVIVGPVEIVSAHPEFARTLLFPMSTRFPTSESDPDL